MEPEGQKKKNLENLEKFFESNIAVKQLLIDIEPNILDEYDKESRMQYLNRWFRVMKEIEWNFSNMLDAFDFQQEIKDEVHRTLGIIKDKVVNHSARSRLSKLHEKYVSEMSEQLVDDIKSACVGYYLRREEEFARVISKAKTVNELLHALHSYVINNEEILESMPILAQKRKGTETLDTYTLYGEPNELAKQIYDSIDVETTDLGITDIVALEDEILMMIRDSGHALTLEIGKEKGKTFVRYFIPKICNTKMVNELPGVRKIPEDSKKPTTGIFELSNIQEGEAGKTIIEFIEKVPTDFDMELPPSIMKLLSRQEKLKSKEQETEPEMQEEKIEQKENKEKKRKLGIWERIIRSKWFNKLPWASRRWKNTENLLEAPKQEISMKEQRKQFARELSSIKNEEAIKGNPEKKIVDQSIPQKKKEDMESEKE